MVWPLVHTHLAFVTAVCGDFKSTETHAICFLVLIRILFFVCLFIFFKCIRFESLENQMFDLNIVDVKHNDAYFVYTYSK